MSLQACHCAPVLSLASWQPEGTPQENVSIDAGNNPVLHSGLILSPLVGAVFLGTEPVVNKLVHGEQRDTENKVSPSPGIGKVAEYQGNRQRKESLSHVVEVASATP